VHNWDALEVILQAQPEVLNHNTETVPRLYRVRPQGNYERTMNAKASVTLLPGFTLWLNGRTRRNRGRNPAVMQDLRAVDCDILTLGQYLQPSQNTCK